MSDSGSDDPTVNDSSTDQGLSDDSTDSAQRFLLNDRQRQQQHGRLHDHHHGNRQRDLPRFWDRTTGERSLARRRTLRAAPRLRTATTTRLPTRVRSYANDTLTQIISGGDGSTTYTQTQTNTDNSTTTQTANDSTGYSSYTMTDVSSATTNETGSSPTTSYTLTETGGTTATDTGSNDSLTGDSGGHTYRNFNVESARNGEPKRQRLLRPRQDDDGPRHHNQRRWCRRRIVQERQRGHQFDRH